MLVGWTSLFCSCSCTMNLFCMALCCKIDIFLLFCGVRAICFFVDRCRLTFASRPKFYPDFAPHFACGSGSIIEKLKDIFRFEHGPHKNKLYFLSKLSGNYHFLEWTLDAFPDPQVVPWVQQLNSLIRVVARTEKLTVLVQKNFKRRKIEVKSASEIISMITVGLLILFRGVGYRY